MEDNGDCHTRKEDYVNYSYWSLFTGSKAVFKQNYKKRMAETEVQRCLNWLLEQKTSFEEADFGSNGQTVHTASQIHAQNKYKLTEYRKNMERVAKNNILTDAETHSLYDTYQDVQAVADKRSCCFEVIKGIATLEEHIQGLSSEFDARAVHLVNLSQNNKQVPGRKLTNESMARSTQNCITGLRENWRWLDEIMQCAHVHLANAATYHQFFHDVEEVESWMKTTMSNMHLSFNKNRLSGDRTDLKDIISEMKDTMLAYLRWQSKVETLYTKAREVVPVHKRTTPVKTECPVLALTSYKTNEIEFKEGETLTLLNNENQSKWRVKNSKDQVGMVPSVILLLNSPTGEAIDAALRLRLQLLGLWTISVKRLGFQMIAFMQLVFKDWSDDEIEAIQAMPVTSRKELQRIIETIENTLKKQWAGYEGFEELQEKISRMKMILEEAGDKEIKAEAGSAGVVVQFKALENLFNTYQEFWTYWETFKVVVELVKQPKYILVCDKWDQLRYVSTAHFVRFWDTKLEFPTTGGKTYRAETALTIHETPKSNMKTESSSIKVQEEIISSETSQKAQAAIPGMFEGQNEEEEDFSSYSTDVTEIRRREETTTNEVVSTTEEMAQSFVIKTVYDPRTEEDLSLDEAITAGIIDIVEEKYIDPITKVAVSLNQAMANGDLIVEFKSQRKIREERSSYGIITIKTSQETRPYSILSVVHPKTKESISVEKARENGILGKEDDSYRTEQGDVINIFEAIERGYVMAEFHGKESDKLAEETKTYAVNSVVDQVLKSTVTFSEAIRRGILDSERGEYVNNLTSERLSITDAIMKGFIKARVLTDDESSNLQIDPTNKIVVQRLAKTKEKILRAVKVARAFKTNVPQTNGN